MNAVFSSMTRPIIKLLLLALMASCSSLPHAPEQSEIRSDEPEHAAPPAPRRDLFGSAVEIPAFNDLTRLTPTQEREFFDWFEAPEHAGVKPHWRIADFLKERLSGVEFNDRTSGAAEALAQGQGNCLSLALVTTAIARTAGVEIDWELTTRNPVYSSDGNIVYSANHVHTRLFDPTYEPQPGWITLVRPHVLLDYFSSRVPISGRTLAEHEVVALTYQNLAAEVLAADDVDRAFHLSLAGLQHDPDNPELYNILGLLHRRKGAWDTAEGYYRHSLEVGGEQLVTLRNLERLLLARNRDDEARRIARRIMALPETDPFPLIELGDEALQRGRIAVALDYYARAREIAPYLHEVHARIAGALLRQGRIGLARESLREAMARTSGSDKSKYYKTKFNKFGRADSTL